MKGKCPDCQASTVGWRFTWRGILYSIICFPCGIYFCFRRRERHCSKCHCEIVSSIADTNGSHGYPYRDYMSTKKGIPGRKATTSSSHRNKAFTSDSQQTEDSGFSISHDNASVTTSQTNLL